MLDGRGYPENVTTLLGHTTALNVLLGANQKGAGRVTLQVQGSGPIPLLVSDCTAELRIRGMAQYRKEAARETAERRLLGDGRLAVTLEDMKSGQFYQSLVPLEGDSLEEIFAHYLSQSEQLPAFLRLFADGDARVRPAAGEAAEGRRARSRRLEPRQAARRHPAPRRDARRPALRPADARVSRGADAGVPPLRGRVPLPVRRGQGEGHAARPGPQRGGVDPRRAGRGGDPQRDVQPRVPLRRRGRSRASSPPTTAGTIRFYRGPGR